ncbi:MAG TPA: bifunctional adenosylcobinamide kinase/adenosylcobinamide-phosphate guanylyltransferase [Anaerolineae bacterium]|nr:bifunctional adenosylcobinamide kinase/adenosylcobinamide-phosphate guanylyltransferase [Anaerolineae bacterium]
MSQSEIILILGGARSGKSTWAENMARTRAGDSVLYIATAEALDDEMRERIDMHRAARPPAWQTREAPRNLPEAIAQLDSPPRLIVLDCLTLWVTNEMLVSERELQKRLLCQLDMLTDWVRLHDLDLIIVSNEVGLGIVPDNELSRHFRDMLGKVNAYVAQIADKVYWMAAGLPIELKSLAVNL